MRSASLAFVLGLTAFAFLSVEACACHGGSAKNTGRTVGSVPQEPREVDNVAVGSTSLTSAELPAGATDARGAREGTGMTGSYGASGPYGMSGSMAEPREQEADLAISRIVRVRLFEGQAGGAPGAFDGVDIVTSAGNVLLRGVVPTAADRANLEATTRSVPGVISVDNQLTVTESP